jgi:hypothetical protein
MTLLTYSEAGDFLREQYHDSPSPDVCEACGARLNPAEMEEGTLCLDCEEHEWAERSDADA